MSTLYEPLSKQLISVLEGYVTQAQQVGELRFGDCFLIPGTFSTADDVSNGYGFLLLDKQILSFTLAHGVVNDSDVLLFDAVTGTCLATCASGLEPELCDVGPVIGRIDVVVVPALGAAIRTCKFLCGHSAPAISLYFSRFQPSYAPKSARKYGFLHKSAIPPEALKSLAMRH